MGCSSTKLDVDFIEEVLSTAKDGLEKASAIIRLMVEKDRMTSAARSRLDREMAVFAARPSVPPAPAAPQPAAPAAQPVAPVMPVMPVVEGDDARSR